MCIVDQIVDYNIHIHIRNYNYLFFSIWVFGFPLECETARASLVSQGQFSFGHGRSFSNPRKQPTKHSVCGVFSFRKYKKRRTPSFSILSWLSSPESPSLFSPFLITMNMQDMDGPETRRRTTVVEEHPASLPESSSSSAEPPSGFILKLFQMVNGAPDEVISVSPRYKQRRVHLFVTRSNVWLPETCGGGNIQADQGGSDQWMHERERRLSAFVL